MTCDYVPAGMFADYGENIQGGGHGGVIKDPLVFIGAGCE